MYDNYGIDLMVDISDCGHDKCWVKKLRTKKKYCQCCVYRKKEYMDMEPYPGIERSIE